MNNITFLEKELKGITLTKTEKKIADYFLENIYEVSLLPATDIAKKIGVSDTSVIRFIRKLDYKSYHDFQRQMKEQLINELNSPNFLLSPASKYNDTIKNLSENNLKNQLLELTFNNIQKTFDNVSYEKVENIANVLIKSNQKFIFGFRGSSSLASFFSNRLNYLLPGVNLCTHADSEVFEKIINITNKDCIMIYSFPIYTQLCIPIIDFAHERNAKIIVVTDKITSPLTLKADYVVTTAINGLGFSNSYVAPMCLNDLLLLVISKITKESAETKRRIFELEENLNKFSLH